MKLNQFILLLFAFALFSCKKFLAIDAPKDKLVQETIFQNDDVATSAQIGIYSKMAISGFACGGISSINTLCGLTADDFIGYNTYKEVYENKVGAASTVLDNALWTTPYQAIYAANAVLEGLATPNGVTAPVKRQLEGEALFIRAFVYFYLVNLYGPIPLNLSTDYKINSNASRLPVNRVYEQIVTDLKTAEGLLGESYITKERIRPNISVVQAMLARTYLYLQDWVNAEKYASLVINKIGTYKLVGLDEVFLKNSLETIWQLMPTANNNASEGSTFILTATPTVVSLTDNLVLNGFEPNDKRRTSWVKTYTNNTGTYYYPSKYKVKTAAIPVEYSMILRLAEQYLIRAEARAQQNNLSDAIDDLDKIRDRAGLMLVKSTDPGINQSDLLNKILQERRVELFSEWGHRWLDLKRTGNANTILSAVKPNYKPINQYYPIPQTEIGRNPNIKQNDGY